ncbi:MAG TPA: hypothetical protein VJQ45_01675 [Ktedonobacterales bacterium]|nr:hypothetical protein [Ktedonobacterales bacterium]
MTRPTPYLLRMVAFVVVVLAVGAFLHTRLTRAFDTNPGLNALILFVGVLGTVWNFYQVMRLGPEVEWVETFQRARTRLAMLRTPKMLAPMASMLAARPARAEGQGSARERVSLSAPAMRSMLDSISSRLDESRELSRYMTALLIFLGLLGTFWGLLLTVGSVGDVIGSMTVGSSDVTQLFSQLKTGLAEPLRGMSTAFSSSMLGLSAALVLGFLDLTAGQAQNRFFNELEEWLAGITRLSSGALAEGETPIPVYVQALLEQTAENMDHLQASLSRGEDGRREANQAILALAERLAVLSDTMKANQQLMLRIAETQASLGPALVRLGDERHDDASRTHLRNIELLLARLTSESEQGRAQSTAELRNEIKILTRTIAALAEEQSR